VVVVAHEPIARGASLLAVSLDVILSIIFIDVGMNAYPHCLMMDVETMQMLATAGGNY
jgi:hypothetical protein